MPVLAAIDIGANSVRLKIASLARGSAARRSLRVLHEDREVTRLGQSVFREGRLAPAAMDHTIRVLRRFQRAVRDAGAEQVRVVGTSPLRDAANAEEFIAWVNAAVGWRLEVVSGLEEGRLIHLGVLSQTRLRAARVLLVDLGGGSCELTISRNGHIAGMHSLPLGAVRLTGDFLAHDPPKKGELRQMREFIREELARVSAPIRRARIELAVATSGTAAALAAACGSPRLVSARMVRELADRLAGSDAAGRARMPGIGTRRAEIVVAGAGVFAELMETCQLRHFRFVPLGLRDGMLAQMAAERQRGGALGRRLAADRGDAVLDVARHFDVDIACAQHVQALALELFRQLRPLHRMPEPWREWLAAAAMLHEVGAYVSHTGRHRHARYLVANSEILGFTPAERLRIANIVRFLGKTQPTVSDRGLQAMSGADAALVARAVALLRVARALNQGRRRAVRGLRARLAPGRVSLKLLTARSGAPLERWALSKENAYFRRIFGRSLSAEAS